MFGLIRGMAPGGLDEDNFVVIYYLIVSDVWPEKRCGLWWEWPGKRCGLWWEWPDKRCGLWWEWPDKRCGLWWEWPGKRCGLWWEWPHKSGTTVLCQSSNAHNFFIIDRWNQQVIFSGTFCQQLYSLIWTTWHLIIEWGEKPAFSSGFHLSFNGNLEFYFYDIK